MSVRQTACRHCGLDIENMSPFRREEWRDRGNNTHCNDAKHAHAPVPDTDPVRAVRKRPPTTPERFWGTGTPVQQMLINDAARILRALTTDDAASWDQAHDWLKAYEQMAKGKG